MPLNQTQRLLRKAKRFVDRLPSNLEGEVMIVGSVGWGRADLHSDLDLEIWTTDLPDGNKAKMWLEAAGLKEIRVEEDDTFIGLFDETWVEVAWTEIQPKEAKLKAVQSGEDISRQSMLEVWNVVHAVGLRSRGRLAKLQKELAEYPDILMEKMIREASDFWRFPHRLEMLWGLAKRGQHFGLNIWLMADVSDGMRILSAINRVWEADWKHLAAFCDELRIKPDRLAERIDDLMLAQDLEQRVAMWFGLLKEILDLVPSSLDLHEVKQNVEHCLQSKGEAQKKEEDWD